ncbi:MAG: thioredoxin family protein [Opitutus sp.]
MKNIFVLCALLVATVAMPAAETTKWTTDYEAALTKAKAENRHVFLFFTGSDWCSWCKRLNGEILSTPEFKSFASEKLILVEVDFPKSKPQSPAVKRQNASLAETHKIEGYPTVIVLDSSGKKVGELGYQEGGPGPFVEALKKM